MSLKNGSIVNWWPKTLRIKNLFLFTVTEKLVNNYIRLFNDCYYIYCGIVCTYVASNSLFTGNDKSKLLKQLHLAVDTTPSGEVLKKVNEEDWDDFYQRYLHDFVRLVHKCSDKLDDDQIREYEVNSWL